MAMASNLREAWHAPLQERLEQSDPPATHQLAPPSLPVWPRSQPSWARCGSLDGSWELLRTHLLEPQFSAMLLTGPLGEPAACVGLAAHPGSSALWVSDCLQRAAQLATWMQAQGIDGRAIHHPHIDPQLIPLLAQQLFTATPSLLLIGPTPHLQLLLQALSDSEIRPDLLLITLRVGASALHPSLNASLEGPTAETIATTLKPLGYQSLSTSGDGQFHLLQRQGASSTTEGLAECAVRAAAHGVQASAAEDAQRPGRLIPPFRLRSLYGDPVIL